MSQVFNSIKEIIAFAKSGAKLAALAASVLQGNKVEGLIVLNEETLKAALAAALWNSPLKLLTVIDTVKSGKKTLLVKQWLQATTELSRELPENKAGDVSRIPDESSFVSAVNVAVAAWEKSWSDFEEAQKLKAEQRASKPVATPAPAAPAAPEPAPPALFENSREAASLRDAVTDAEERQKSAETRLASALWVAREREKTLESANERIAELEAQLRESQESRNFLQAQLISATAEITVLRAAQTAPARKRARKETTA